MPRQDPVKPICKQYRKHALQYCENAHHRNDAREVNGRGRNEFYLMQVPDVEVSPNVVMDSVFNEVEHNVHCRGNYKNIS